jgi:Mrp family chromosome partitioning ATPase
MRLKKTLRGIAMGNDQSSNEFADSPSIEGQKVPSTSALREALAELQHPEFPQHKLVDLGMFPEIQVEGNHVLIHLALPYKDIPIKTDLIQKIRETANAMAPDLTVQIEPVEMTGEQRRAFVDRVRGRSSEQTANRHVEKVLAVMSGKGGVGKSTVAGLLACSLRRAGHAVGILDADITGPSIPKLFGLRQPPQGSPEGILPPLSASGIKIISINLMLENEEQPVVWRGPLIARTIEQFWNDIAWGSLDYLIVDLPPGTSDAALTVMQSLALHGIVLVTSPQDLAGMVVRKAANMAIHLGVPLIGLVENMSFVVCPECGSRIEIFGSSRAAATAQQMGAPLLGRMPLDPRLAIMCDEGSIEQYSTPNFEEITEAISRLVPVS